MFLECFSVVCKCDTGLLASAGRGSARAPRQVTLNGIIYSDKVHSLSDLSDDDDAAAAEALAQGGRPGYCGDRYFKAAAGGHFCDHFDSRR